MAAVGVAADAADLTSEINRRVAKRGERCGAARGTAVERQSSLRPGPAASPFRLLQSALAQVVRVNVDCTRKLLGN